MDQNELVRELESLRGRMAELHESQANYEAIVQAFDGLIYICSSDYRVEFMNRQFIERTGHNPVGEDCYKAIHELESVCPWCVNERVLRGETVRWEVQSPKDQRWYYVVNTPIYHPDGSVSKMSMIQDVTEKKQSEIELRQEENLYRQVIESASDIIYRADRDGLFTLVNPVALRISGYSERELIGRSYLDLIVPEYRSAAKRFYGIQFVKKTPNTYHELPFLTRDGAVVWVGQNVQLLEEEGEVVGFQAIARDITARKNLEEGLARSNKEWQETFAAVSDLIMVLDDQHRIVRVNKAMVDALGLAESEIMGKRCHQVVHGETVPLSFCPHTKLLADGKNHSTDFQEPRLGGTFDVRVSPLFDEEGQVRGSVHVARDMTERQLLERLAFLEKERFETLAECSPFGMVLIGQGGVFEYVNPMFREMFGYGLHEVRNGREFFRKAYPDASYRHEVISAWVNDATEAKPGYNRSRTFTVRCKDNSEKIVRFRPVRLDTGGDLVTCEDITAQTLAEEDLRKSEQALRQSEEKYKLLVEESFDGIFVQKWTKIVFTNSRLREMLGYEAGELEGQNHWVVYHPEYQEITRERAKARLRGEPVPSRYEVRMQRKDGSSFEAEINARAVEFVGEPGIQVWIRDISERKRAEHALRESEERFRTAFQTSPDPIAISRLSDGVFVEANDGFTKLSGFTREEVIGRSSSEISIWHDARDRDRLISELNERGYVTNLEAQFRLKEGRVRAGLMSARIMDLGGEPHILTITRDVEEWKKAEQALRESEEKYRTLFEESIDAVYMTTREGILVDANQAFLDLFGFSREESMNMDILQIYIDATDRKRFQEEIERKGSLKDYEVRFRKKDGTKIDGLLTSTVRRDKDGTVLGYQGIIRDVTEHKQLQKQLLQAQKMEAIGTLAGGIAHDFNNLLQAILGYTDLLLMQKKESDPDCQKLEIVRQAAQDGGDLVSRILAFSMKAEFRARPTDLNQEIRRAEKLLRRTVPRMIKIDLVLADDLWVIDADPAQIEQVLLNLAVNAQHAMPDGGQLLIETNNVSLKDEYLRTHFGAKSGNHALLTVSDTGKGMEPEVVERIFEPFFTTKADGEGTGLGLAMVHGIVSQHGGYIRCYSEPGLGTSFKIYFPVSESECVPDAAVTREMPAFGTETVLLVDDDDRIREVAQELIEMGGYKVLAASSGEEALEIHAAHKGEVSLVILDLIMPGMGGKKCLEELLRIDPDARVLLASGYSSNGLTVVETGTGARGFIRKPYDANDILAAIRKVMDQGHL